MTSGSDWLRLCDLMSQLHGVKVMVVGIDDLRSHDSAHEEDGPWRKTKTKTYPLYVPAYLKYIFCR